MQHRSVWENEWTELSPFFNPRRSFFNSDYPTDEDGKPVSDQIYDTACYLDARTMRDGLVGYNVGPRIRWAKLVLTVPELMDLPFVKDWLEQCENALYKIWSSSNFYSASSEMILDAITIGTATMSVETTDRRMQFHYSCRHPRETYISESEGIVNCWYRRMWLRGSDMLKRYTEPQLGSTIYKQCQDKKTDRGFLIHNFLHPRGGDYQQSYGPTGRRWKSVEFMDAKEGDSEAFLRETGFFQPPLMTWRYEKNAQEQYGRSPAMMAKWEAMRTNEVGRTMTEKVQLDVERPLNVPDELRGTERIMPWGLNYYKADNRKIEPWDLGGSYPIGIDWLDRLEQRSHEHFHSDLFKMLSQAERQMTAREINERMGEKVALLSSPLTGQNSEMLAPMIKRDFHAAMRLGWLPRPPAALVKMNVDIDIEFIGPLAQAQQTYHQSHNLNAALGTINAYVSASGHAEAWDNIDGDVLTRRVAETEGVDQDIIREVTVRDKLRAERAKRQQQQQQLDQAKQLSEMMPLEKRPEPGSIAETVASSAGALPTGTF